MCPGGSQTTTCLWVDQNNTELGGRPSNPAWHRTPWGKTFPTPRTPPWSFQDSCTPPPSRRVQQLGPSGWSKSGCWTPPMSIDFPNVPIIFVIFGFPSFCPVSQQQPFGRRNRNQTLSMMMGGAPGTDGWTGCPSGLNSALHPAPFTAKPEGVVVDVGAAKRATEHDDGPPRLGMDTPQCMGEGKRGGFELTRFVLDGLIPPPPLLLSIHLTPSHHFDSKRCGTGTCSLWGTGSSLWKQVGHIASS